MVRCFLNSFKQKLERAESKAAEPQRKDSGQSEEAVRVVPGTAGPGYKEIRSYA